MSNVTKRNPMIIDTEGIISVVPLTITKITMKQAATGDFATLNCWDEGDTVAKAVGDAVITATASSGTLASSDGTTDNFETDDVNQEDIIEIIQTSSGDNLGYWQIATNADDHTVTLDKPATVFGQVDVTMANDTSEKYSYKIWHPYLFRTIKGSGITNDTSDVDIDFPESITVPNLALNTLDTSTVLYIYLKG